MRLSSFAVLLALLLPAGIVQAQAQAQDQAQDQGQNQAQDQGQNQAQPQGRIQLPTGASHFAVLQDNKNVGSSEFTVTPTSSGYTITSNGNLRLTKLTYSFTNSQKLDPMLNLVSDRISGTVNGSPVTFSAAADPSGRQFNLTVQAKGKTTTNTVDRHRHMALLPDLDAAGYMLLTRIGLENPKISWVLIPKENGLLVPTVYERDASVRGRLNGREITVNHTTVTVSAENAISVELFYGQDGRLLEADLPQQNFYVVRDGFELIHRPKFAPPRSPEAPPQQEDTEPQAQQ